MALYFVNAAVNKKYKVLEFDRKNQIVKLQGQNASFVEKYDKEKFKKLGYQLVDIAED